MLRCGLRKAVIFAQPERILEYVRCDKNEVQRHLRVVLGCGPGVLCDFYVVIAKSLGR
jgi:hypothetical protein